MVARKAVIRPSSEILSNIVISLGSALIASARSTLKALACLLTAMILIGCTRPPQIESESYWVKGQEPSTTVIVFFHGVLGDSRTTWSAEGVEGGWPTIVQHDPKLPRSDVLAVGYRSTPLEKASTIEEIAVRALSSLKDEGIFNDYESVIFVAHSMGGLIVKRLLKTLQDDQAKLEKVKAVVFFATPAHGSDLAGLATWMSKNPQFRDMSSSDLSSFLQVLDNDWKGLLRKRTQSSPFPRSFCAYETLDERGLAHVVPKWRSESGCDETPIAFDRDHSGIVKPHSADDEVHKYLRARILAALDPMLVPQEVEVRLIKANGSLLTEGDWMMSGDQYSIHLKSRRAAWFYIFGVDSTGRAQRFFPTEAGGKQEHAVKALRVPQAEMNYLTLDNNKGVERIYVFVLEGRDEKLLGIGTPIEGEEKESSVELENFYLSYRGVAAVQPRKPDKTGVTPVPVALKGATEILLFEHR